MRESIVEMIAWYAQETPDKLCIADVKNEVTYREFWEHIVGYANHLKDMGVKKGDCVVVKNSQTIETVLAGMAIQLLGGVFVPVEKNIADKKVSEIIEFTNAKCYVAANVIDSLCCYENILNVFSYRSVCSPATWELFPASEEMAEVLFTTGTTGVAKGIQILHKNIIAVSENVIYGVEMEKDNVELIPSPLSHSHGLRRYYANMANGSTVVLLSTVMFVQDVFRLIEKYRVTAIDFIPAALSSFLKLSKGKLGEYKDQIRYIQTGGAAISETEKDELCRLLPNSRLYNFYGTTESGCSCIFDFNLSKNKRNCIGKPTRHSTFAFFNEEGEEINATKEEPGYLGCSGNMNMLGYYKEEALNKEIMVDGYIRSQDLAYKGADGLIYMVGRKSDVIQIGGNKIAPQEIEEIAISFQGVNDCACIAVENPLLGNEPKLYVVVKNKERFDCGTLYEYLKERLEVYKVPKKIEIIDKIPRTYNGKILRRELQGK